MFVFGGERKGQLLHDLWKFNFSGQFWEKITTLQGGMLPNPRSRHTAVGNPFIHLDASTNERIEVTSTEESSSMHSPLSPLDPDVGKRSQQQQQQQQQQHNSLQHSSSLTDPAAVTMNPSRLLHQQPRQEGESILNPEKEHTMPAPQDEKENESNHRFPGIRIRRRRKNRLISSKDRPMSDFILECASPEKVAADAAAAAVVNNDVHYKNRMMNTLGTSMFPEETEWPVFGQNKRYTVHESMSYYALCFPSPQLSSSIQRKANQVNQVNGHFDNREGGNNNSISLVRPLSPKFSTFRPQQNENSCYANQSNMSNCNNDSSSNGNSSSGSSNYNSSNSSSNNNNNNNIHMNNNNNNSRSSSSSSSNSGSNESSTAVSPDALLATAADSRVPLMRNQTDLLLQTRAFDVDVDAACLELRIQSPPALTHALLSQNGEVARRRRRNHRPQHPPSTRRTIDTFDPSSLDFTCEFEEDDLLNCISQSRSVNFDSIVTNEIKVEPLVEVKKCTATATPPTSTTATTTFNNDEGSINMNNINNNNNNNNNNSNSNSSTLNNGKSASSNANSTCHNSQQSHFNQATLHQANANSNANTQGNQEAPSVILPIRRAWSAYSPSKFNLMNYVNSGCKSNNRLDSRCSGGNLHESSQVVCSSSTTTAAGGEKTCNSNDWQLCMYVFGGREDGATFAYKQPISVWKLYIWDEWRQKIYIMLLKERKCTLLYLNWIQVNKLCSPCVFRTIRAKCIERRVAYK